MRFVKYLRIKPLMSLNHQNLPKILVGLQKASVLILMRFLFKYKSFDPNVERFCLATIIFILFPLFPCNV